MKFSGNVDMHVVNIQIIKSRLVNATKTIYCFTVQQL